MKKMLFIFILVIMSAIVFLSCASGSVKGKISTIKTLSGDSFEAIVLLDNIWESAKIARSNDNNYILYVDIMTNGSARPGSVIIYIDGNRFNIANPTDWNLDDVSVSQYGTAYYWSTYKPLGNSIIEAIKNANNISIRAVGGNAFMAKDEGVDISKILPELKGFVNKNSK